MKEFHKIKIILGWLLLQNAFATFVYSEIIPKETWSLETKIADTSGMLPFVQEANNRTIIYTGLALLELSEDGVLTEIVQIPDVLSKQKPEAFYYDSNSKECFIVNRSNARNFRGAKLYCLNIVDSSTKEVSRFPDIYLGQSDVPKKFVFKEGYLRVVYEAGNMYYFRVNLEDKKFRGYVFRFSDEIVYAELANWGNLVYLFRMHDRTNGNSSSELKPTKLFSLYDPAGDRILWQYSSLAPPKSVPIMNSLQQTFLIDEKLQALLIDKKGQRSILFDLTFASDETYVEQLVSPNGQEVCFLTAKEVIMVSVEQKRMLWQSQNDFGAKNIIRFDSQGVILDDYSENSDLRAFRMDGEKDWEIKLPEGSYDAYPPMPVIRNKNVIIVFSEKDKLVTIKRYDLE